MICPAFRVGRWPHGLPAVVAAIWVLALSASPVYADTFNITGTVQFATGMRKLATITLDRDAPSLISWGDGTTGQPPILVDCRGFLNRTCDVYGTHLYRELGAFEIQISYWPPTLFPSEIVETATATIVPVGNFVVLSIGDSVASGEGNPVILGNRVFDGAFANQGLWDDPGSHYGYPVGDPQRGECHRTRGAGPALTASHLRSTNPTSGITFLHVACSGADVDEVIAHLKEARRALERARIRQGGAAGGPPITIDALLMSVGANNIAGGFGSIVGSCLSVGSDCSTDAALHTQMAASLAALPGQYQSLANEIQSPSAGTRGPATRVYITEYFDPTRMEDGNFPTTARSVGCTGGLISPAEWEFMANNLVVPLNNAVSAAANAHGWVLVDGIADEFRTHGYCAQPGPFALTGDSWVVKAPESFDQQGDLQGTAHANGPGQAHYHARILSRVIQNTPPATTAAATAGGSGYPFGVWTPLDVQVTLAAGNPIQQSGVGGTFFAVDGPACTPAQSGNCTPYTGPFVIATSGKHVVRFFSKNAHGEFESANEVEVWIDKDPPAMTCTATPNILWAPNGRMRPISTSVVAIDNVSGPVPFVLSAITTSEQTGEAQWLGFTPGQPDTAGQLLAQRLGSGSGRVYTLKYQSSDAFGNTGSCEVVVTVPHDQRK